MSFLTVHHDSIDEIFSRLLFYSVMIHYLFFYLLFGNPFLLRLGDDRGQSGSEKHFDIDLVSFPTRSVSSTNALLGLFPAEILNGDDRNTVQAGVSRPAFNVSETQSDQGVDSDRLPDMKHQNSAKLKGDVPINGQVTVRSENDPLQAGIPIPLVTSKKMPPNMTGPQDCMIKVVGMVCPNGDAACITSYIAFCSTLPD